MAETVSGFVARLNEKHSAPGAKRPWTLYSALIEKEDGSEYGWVSFGFEKPPINEGDYVSGQIEIVEGQKRTIQGTWNKPKNPPARARAKASTSNVEVLGSGSSGADRQTQIVMQHSQEMAIGAVALLLEHKGLPMSAATGKAGEAKRYDEIMAFIDKLTVQLYNDVVTGRLLDVVADAGADRVSTKADGPLPEGEKKDDSDGSTNSPKDSGDKAGNAGFSDAAF